MNAAAVVEIAIPDDIPLSEDARKSILENIFYVDATIVSAAFQSDSMILRLAHAGVSDTAEVIEKVTLMCRKTSESFSRVSNSIEYEHSGSGSYIHDPHDELFRTRQYIETGTGIAVYRGNLLRLMHGLDAIFREFALRLGADEQSYPTTLPVRSLADSGYLGGFPQHAIFATPARPDLEAVENVADPSRRTVVDDALMLPHGTLEHPSQLLAPTICHHCFEALRGQLVDPEKPLLVTAIGRCHRHEYRTTKGLERLQTFTMRELIVCGNESDVAAIRTSIADFGCETFARLGINLRLVGATDPFFATEAAGKRSFQSIFGLKRELQFYLPYSRKWLSVGSINNHRDKLVRSFEILCPDSTKPLVSSCVGFGYERMALGILAQFGVDAKRWPAEVQRIIH